VVFLLPAFFISLLNILASIYNPNNSINTDWLTAGFARFQPAGYVKRVCRAWHVTTQVQVLGPGFRRTEG